MEPSESPKRPCPMDERERFAKLYDVIVDIFRAYTANFVWTAGLLSLAIGWFLSSESSRVFIHGSSTAFVGAIVVTSVVALLHTGSCLYYSWLSKKKITEMTLAYSDLQPLPFRDYEVRAPVVIGSLAVSLTLAAGLIAFLVAARIN